MAKDAVIVAIDTMTSELGTRVGPYWIAEFSVKDVLTRVGKKNTQVEQNYVRYVIQKWYNGCKILPGQGDNGGTIKIRFRGV